jgi:Flp pilus assembly protein TadG
MRAALNSWMRRRGLGKRGIAAVEFALVAPLLILIALGTIEMLTLYRTESKLNALAFNVATMVSAQASPLALTATNTASLNDICTGAVYGMAPYPPGGLTIAVASVTMQRGPDGNPATNTASSFVYNAAYSYDVWEADSTVTGHTCSTSGTNANKIGGANAIALATATPTGVTCASGAGAAPCGQVEVPCDNAIIVTASITYPGITGLILNSTSRPVLTQTSYTRWLYGSETTQLLCPTCTLTPTTPLDLCNSNNTSALN